jgi:RNA polymerase sigma-70 factor (ECF subfamily)
MSNVPETRPVAGDPAFDAARVDAKSALLAEIPSMRAFATSLSGHHDMADDLVQETLVKAWAAYDTFKPGSNLRAWLFTILRNTYFSQYRKRRHEVQDVDGVAGARLSASASQGDHLDLEDFRRALAKLPAEQREALILIGASGFSYEEAAAVSECAVGTIKSRVNRARAKLVDMLGMDSANDLGPDVRLRAHAL